MQLECALVLNGRRSTINCIGHTTLEQLQFRVALSSSSSVKGTCGDMTSMNAAEM